MSRAHSAPLDPALPPTANTIHTAPENRLYFPALDGLRSLAVVMVFLQHYLHAPWCYTGVDLFFVLSGFLITGILFDTRNRPRRARDFYIRRSLRIFPLYYTVFLLLLLLTPVLHPRWTAFWWAWPTYLGNLLPLAQTPSSTPAFLLATSGQLSLRWPAWGTLYLGHFWSLCLEEQFYLLWPWVVFAANTWRRLVIICIAVILILPLVRTAGTAIWPLRFTNVINYAFTPLRLDALLFGALLALLIRSPLRQITLRLAPWLLLLALVSVVPLVISALHHPWLTFPYPAGRLTWGQSLVDLAFTALVASALPSNTLTFWLFNRRILRYVGRISYGIYVFHDIPHLFYSDLAMRILPDSITRHGNLAAALVAAPCTLVFAALSFRFLESPFLDLKERWAPSRPVTLP